MRVMDGPVVADNCASLRERYEVGQVVEGTVVDHREFGVFVDVGSPECLGVVLLPNIEDTAPPNRDAPADPRPLAPGEVRLHPWYPIYPPIGSTVRCVLFGFAALNSGQTQPRLSMRPSDLKRATPQSRTG